MTKPQLYLGLCMAALLMLAAVIEGQIVMQLKGQPAVTLNAGQTFYEGPNDVHIVGRNASNTEPARFVVVLLKGKGTPILTPVRE